MARPTLFVNRKFLRLSRRLGSRPLALGHLELIWHAANETGNPVLGSAEDVEALAYWDGAPGELVAALMEAGSLGEAGFIELRDDGRYEVHDYWHHAPEYARTRHQKEASRTVTHFCDICDKPFRAADRRAIYCSDACRARAYRSRKSSHTVTDENEALQGNVTDANGERHGPSHYERIVTDRHTTPAPAPAPLLRVAIDTSQLDTTVTARANELNGSQKPARRRLAKRCPADFVVTDEMRAWAKEKTPGVDLDAQTERFRDYEFARARSDWPATWRNWMRKAAELKPNGDGAVRPQQRRLTRYEEIAAIQQRSIDEAES